MVQSPNISAILESNPRYNLVNCENRECFFQEVNEILSASYPRFLIEDFIVSEPWNHLCSVYPEFQFGLVEVKTNKMIAQGSCVPIPWYQPIEELPHTGCDWVLMTGLEAKVKNITPTILSPASLAILPEYQGQGLSHILLDYMQELARCYQYPTLILAARPTLKHLYPLTPIERYINWQNEAGFAFDPWLRTNLKRGAKLIGICDRSTVMHDTISNWERLTDLRFPETGHYIIQGAIAPLEIDCESDLGTYIEPNIWLSYTVS